MSVANPNAVPLVLEYETLVLESTSPGDNNIDWKRLQGQLSDTAEWTEEGAVHLVNLSRSYGAFMLRNALALAVAAGIEDGELGF